MNIDIKLREKFDKYLDGFAYKSELIDYLFKIYDNDSKDLKLIREKYDILYQIHNKLKTMPGGLEIIKLLLKVAKIDNALEDIKTENCFKNLMETFVDSKYIKY
ncbi:hypothetical protein CHBEV_318 [Choristoneura biennis entomopoxvirus]|uniref:Uncharacterized protein n=1 Tax=Choristoneura biennis entomopoxvirus TaxID=10288 RepID=A0A916KPS5_CBEPV|nr:hypothetical protein CHBEV_017 [Choristoneura biennis entomopoxvirus]YP_008004388.1 hypothetical protein CHBEV_318 [Choristoneura biennis entomopoxvirus]CCU55585.1 hypothetical protein CHBEV_017 [Choristoneura biennis entomopoxvirus]CCU55886.1 hypothetical protein CHBEV_318 [Choristoneura biennis entomopoxvirus]